MANIGFVGLGHMGLLMAVNLVKKGHTVTGFDMQAQAMESFKAQGGLLATDLHDVAKNQSVVITMLQTGQQVHSVCLGGQGIFRTMQPRTLFLDCSTIGAEAIQLIHQEAVKHNLYCLDAPVSGGMLGASNGTLTMMIGGDLDVFEKAKPILACLGTNLIHTGRAGSGQAAKLCNNMILGASMIAVSEAFLLAERLGLSAQKLYEVVTRSSGQCWAMSQHAPVPGVAPNSPANFNYQPGFSATMMLKDLALSQSAGAAVGLNMPLTATATQIYEKVKDDIGALDFSAIVTCLPQFKD